MIEALPTTYRGVNFRSRLEARWAFFLDYLDTEWLYEPQRYVIEGLNGEQWTYLPDFFLPATKTWVEVKGAVGNVDWRMLTHAVDGPGAKLPFVHDSYRSNRAGLLLLGALPNLGVNTPLFPLLQHRDGGHVTWATPIDEWVTPHHVGLQHQDVKFNARDAQGDRLREEWLQYTLALWGDLKCIPLVPPPKIVLSAYREARRVKFN